MKRKRFLSPTLAAVCAAGALVSSPFTVPPLEAEEVEGYVGELTLENREDEGWFDRAVEAAGPAYREADEFKRDSYYLTNEEDMTWFDRAVTAAGPDYTDADEFE